VSRPAPGAIELPDFGDEDDQGDYCDRYAVDFGNYCDQYAAALDAAVASGASWDEAVAATRLCRHQSTAEQLLAIRNCTARRH
jgi:hypothetical protein